MSHQPQSPDLRRQKSYLARRKLGLASDTVRLIERQALAKLRHPTIAARARALLDAA